MSQWDDTYDGNKPIHATAICHNGMTCMMPTKLHATAICHNGMTCEDENNGGMTFGDNQNIIIG